MIRTLLSSLALVAALAALSACPAQTADPKPKPAKAKYFSEPKAFLQNLVALARTADAEGWAKQLTDARQARGAEYLKKHFEAWKPALLKLAPTIETLGAVLIAGTTDDGRQIVALKKADGTVDRLMRVSTHEGTLRIDEN